jgi:hypothetical protein
VSRQQRKQAIPMSRVGSGPHSFHLVSFSASCDVTFGQGAAFAGPDAVLANHHESAHKVRHLAVIELWPLCIKSMPDLMRAS